MSQPQLITDLPATIPNVADPMLALVERAARDQSIDVEKMGKLLAMAERLQERKAEAEYDAAMNAAQSQMRPVANDSDNPQTRSRYASYGALDRAVRPIYTEHGFSLSFGTKSPNPERVTVTCRVSHRAGHTERVEIDMPADGKGAKGGDVMTKTHATGSAVSYGMRYLLKMIFNIAAGEYDDDGNAAGRASKPPQTPAMQRPAQPTTTPRPQATASPAPATKPNPAAIEAWLNMHKTKLIAQLAPNRDAAIDYGKAAGILLPGDDLEDGSVTNWFPGIDWGRPIADNEAVVAAVKQRHLAGVAAMMDGHQIPDPSAPPRKIVLPAQKPAITACPHCNHSGLKPDGEYVGMTICQFCGWRFDESGKCWEAHPWQYVICPVPPKGASKKEYDKHPITLGQMERTDNKRAFGMVMNFAAEPREWKGKIYQPSAADIKFAQACEQARAHLQKTKPDSDYDDGLLSDL